MCIALISTCHPEYPLILIDNRDEFLNRPTAPASWWPPPDEHVLGGRDLLRAEQGTWLGITRQGRVAVLTNFRDQDQTAAQAAGALRSRGAMVNEWLKQPAEATESTGQFVERLCGEPGGLKTVGGFSLMCGRIEVGEDGISSPLAIVSNRTAHAQAATWIARSAGETHGLSNSAYADEWPKVQMGKRLLAEAIEASVEADEAQEALVSRLFRLLSTDTLPAKQRGESLDHYMRQLRNSIFIPLLIDDGLDPRPAEDRASKSVSASTPGAVVYGTQKQTVVLVDRRGQVYFVERTLFSQDLAPIPAGQGDRVFSFAITSSG